MSQIRGRKGDDRLAGYDAEVFHTKLTSLRDLYSNLVKEGKEEDRITEVRVSDQMDEVIEMLEEAFRSSQLTLKEAHPELDSVAVEAFSGREDDIFRAVHFFRDNGLFFSREGKNFRNINRLLRQGQIASVKRLMVYQNKDELDDPRSQRLVRFHSNTKGYSYRIIAAKHFQSILVRNRLPTSGDFGLYGRHYVYEVVKNPSRRVVAIWSWDPAKVSSFTETFEACWKSTYSNELSGKLGGRILVRDLFHEK